MSDQHKSLGPSRGGSRIPIGVHAMPYPKENYNPAIHNPTAPLRAGAEDALKRPSLGSDHKRRPYWGAKSSQAVQRIVISKGANGFALSEEAMRRYEDYTRRGCNSCQDIPRYDPMLVQVVEELGGDGLEIVSIPMGVPWTIEERDGVEWVSRLIVGDL